jgi:xylulokinase
VPAADRERRTMKILALDVGTSSVKAAVLDVDSARPAGPVGRAGYALDHPAADAAEVPAERVWEAVAHAARAATAGKAGAAVEGVGLSCLTPALVLLDERDRPLAPVWTHLDRRARPVARRVWADVGPEFLATAGNRPLPGGMSVTCYRQQADEDPSMPGRVRGYLHLNGWLGLRLTGERAFDPANACFTGLFNTATDQRWSERWCAYFGVEPAWLPGVVDGASTLGQLREESARELGVSPGVPVKLGTADTSSAILAAGMGEEDLLHVVGTTQVLAALAGEPEPAEHRLTRRLGVGPGFVHVTHNPVGGVALEWAHELCFREVPEEDFYEKVVPEAMGRATGVVLDPPYLGGDRLEIEVAHAGLRELTLGAGRLDVLAAVLSAMAREHGKALAALGKGEKFRRVFLTGGGADVVRKLIPAYSEADVEHLEEGSLCGVARLWKTEDLERG